MTTTKEAIFDELLVLRSKCGERAALNELISRWESRLFYYIRRLVDEEQDAWDILQKTWLKVLKSLPTLREPRSFPGWLYRIARNTALSHSRMKRSHVSAREVEADCELIEDEPNDFSNEDAEQVHQALARLTVLHREVLTLHFLEALSVAEIAEIVGVPVGTVKSRLHHAGRSLRAILERED